MISSSQLTADSFAHIMKSMGPLPAAFEDDWKSKGWTVMRYGCAKESKNTYLSLVWHLSVQMNWANRVVTVAVQDQILMIIFEGRTTMYELLKEKDLKKFNHRLGCIKHVLEKK